MSITILNTSILTTVGTYNLSDITVDEARNLVGDGKFISAVGHETTAQLLSTILGVKIPMNRIFYEQKLGDIALVFKLSGRPPEGVILSIEEIEKIGYKFQLLTKLDDV